MIGHDWEMASDNLKGNSIGFWFGAFGATLASWTAGFFTQRNFNCIYGSSPSWRNSGKTIGNVDSHAFQVLPQAHLE